MVKAGLRVTVPAGASVDRDGYGRRELVDGDAEGREIVELGFEVLQVEGEVEHVIVSEGCGLGFAGEHDAGEGRASHEHHGAAG